MDSYNLISERTRFFSVLVFGLFADICRYIRYAVTCLLLARIGIKTDKNLNPTIN